MGTVGGVGSDGLEELKGLNGFGDKRLVVLPESLLTASLKGLEFEESGRLRMTDTFDSLDRKGNGLSGTSGQIVAECR